MRHRHNEPLTVPRLQAASNVLRITKGAAPGGRPQHTAWQVNIRTAGTATSATSRPEAPQLTSLSDTDMTSRPRITFSAGDFRPGTTGGRSVVGSFVSKAWMIVPSVLYQWVGGPRSLSDRTPGVGFLLFGGTK